MDADLHIHTKFSNGTTGVDEVIFLAKKKNLKMISVTDKDTFSGSSRARIFGKKHGIEVVPGIEFSTYDYKRKKNVHVLCYMCDFPERLEGLCKKIYDIRREAITIMIHKTMRIYPIFPEMILRRAQGCSNIFVCHIAHALMDAGYTDAVFGNLYWKLSSKRTGLAFVQPEFPPTEHVLNEIRKAGGIAVLAHPGIHYIHDIAEELAEKGLIDGIEVWHPKNTEQDREIINDLADNFGLIRTGGTDFHGMYMHTPNPVGTCVTPEDQFKAMKKLKNLRKKGKI